MLRNVFVYGTLMRRMSNSRCIPNGAIEKIEEGTVTGRLYYVSSGHYPCLKLNGDNTIYGELYTIKEKHWKETLASMDALEGCPTLYTREQIKVKTKNGEKDAWVYVFNLDEFLGEEITSGRFTGPKRSKNLKTQSVFYL